MNFDFLLFTLNHLIINNIIIMWNKLALLILRYRIALLILLLIATAFMARHASRVKLSYEFVKAIPSDNLKSKEYNDFKKQFGDDGNVLVIGIQTDHFFKASHFNAYRNMLQNIKSVKGVENILSVPGAISLVKSDTSEKLIPTRIFNDTIDQANLDTTKNYFENLIFYKRLLYNPGTNAYLAAVTINKDLLATKERVRVINEIVAIVSQYGNAKNIQTYLSGLALIRTQIADRIKNEMGYFLLGSILLAAITLILFFRSFSATILSLFVVIIGVVWAFGCMELLGYKITLLNALIPPLIIVIGIPNCIYFFNKYHMSWIEAMNKGLHRNNDTKQQVLITMIEKMGVVTLFCNIAAAVGFAVFALTKSPLLYEFGVVAGINIMVIFIISLILIPTVLSYLPIPKERHVRYLNNRLLENILVKIEYWVLQKKQMVYTITSIVVILSVAGIFKLKSVAFIVDDLPKKDKIYTDLKWFEKNFGGVMPLEIVIDTKKKNGVTSNLKTIEKIDELSAYISARPECSKPLNIVEGLKFAKQAYYDQDSSQYTVPNEFDMAFIGPYLKMKGSVNKENTFNRLLKTFMDSTRQRTRVSINMADIGTMELPKFLDSLKHASSKIFDSSYNVQFTGGSVTYLEGSHYIINGLKESIMWAFVLITLCMLYLFRSFRILLCSLIPNIIPLVVTAGVMGWAGVPLKPSTVLIFSVALGIAIDVTIRFLVNYKQELSNHYNNVLATTTSTIRHTGISIIYTSFVLVAGFIIFCLSHFGGTFALGWLTSFTLLVATFTNLIFLPVILIAMFKKQKN